MTRFSPVSWGAVIAGQITLALGEAPVVFLLMWLLGYVFRAADLGFKTLLVVTVGLIVISAFLTVILQRPFVVRSDRAQPGGVGYAFLPVLATAAVVAGMMVPTLGVQRGVSALLAMTAVDLALVLYLRLWRPGDTDTEFAKRWDATKDTTRESWEGYRDEIVTRAGARRLESYRKKLGDSPRSDATGPR